ncbi:MAG: Gfo/Idh/MocA family oxidoreductase [Vulcanimicrobiota bacterium]
MTPIRVGIIGMQVDRSWGAIAHVPALRALPEYEISAVSTTRRESADAAAAHYKIPRAFVGHEALVTSPDVDLVTVTVKVPAHLELVSAAIAAGKHVFCEWPLGNGLAEAEQMAALARSAGVKTAIGLQAHVSPTISYVRDLVKDGRIGDILSSVLIGRSLTWGSRVQAPNAYTADRANGATMLSIPVGHTLDAVCSVLGELQQVTGVLAQGRTETVIEETGETIPMTAHDQIGLVARTENGVVLTTLYYGGTQPGTGLLWEIYGSSGTLRVSGEFGHMQIADLKLEGALGERTSLAPLDVPERYFHTELRQGPPLNVAELYHRFAKDLHEGTNSCPDFDHAVIRHKMLEAIAD